MGRSRGLKMVIPSVNLAASVIVGKWKPHYNQRFIPLLMRLLDTEDNITCYDLPVVNYSRPADSPHVILASLKAALMLLLPQSFSLLHLRLHPFTPIFNLPQPLRNTADQHESCCISNDTCLAFS